jgi:hypothetical protein
MLQPVNFELLDMTTLKRFKKLYKLRTRVHSSKSELVYAIAKHFEGVTDIDEQETIEAFLTNLRN